MITWAFGINPSAGKRIYQNSGEAGKYVSEEAKKINIIRNTLNMSTLNTKILPAFPLTDVPAFITQQD